MSKPKPVTRAEYQRLLERVDFLEQHELAKARDEMIMLEIEAARRRRDQAETPEQAEHRKANEDFRDSINAFNASKS